ncbi:MarR family winged helix-turn-helix transcriptional regulator [Brevibacillus massiliensis]|uniref:MarR family winged helix-turn-helix transcriptional regulator n=1 Tax=Brevibacillus massiliensis TaxID=1118054 RepID=UPI0002D7148D|nr:MarR family transcriptional regulator [Brevibacillus massiliensis]
MKTNLIDEPIGFLMGITYRRMVQYLQFRLKEYGITPEQWLVLFRLGEQDGINQKEIAVRSAKDQPTTARILDVLHKKSLIEKRTCPMDRRSFLVTMTEKGKALLEQTIPVERKAVDDMLDGVDHAQLELFRRTLWQINQNIDHQLRE